MIILTICRELQIKFGGSWPDLTRENWLSIIPEELVSVLESQTLRNSFEQKINALKDFALTYYSEENENKTICCYSIAIDYVINTPDYVSPLAPRYRYDPLGGYVEKDENTLAESSVDEEIVGLMCLFLQYNGVRAITYYFSQNKLGTEDNLKLIISAMSKCVYESDVLAEFCKRMPIDFLKNFDIDYLEKRMEFGYVQLLLETDYKTLIDHQFVMKNLFDYFLKKHQEIRGLKSRLKSFKERLDDFLCFISLLSKHILNKDMSRISRVALEKDINGYLKGSGKEAEEKIKNTAAFISADNYRKHRASLINMIKPINFETLIVRYQEFEKIILELVNDSSEQKSSKMILARKIYSVMAQTALVNNSEEMLIESSRNKDSSSNIIQEADESGLSINDLPNELIVKILMKAKTPQELLSWGLISPRLRGLVFDKTLWESFVPEELRHHQYSPRVYQFFARIFLAPQYQYSLTNWLKNPQKFHEDLVKWSDPMLNQDYLTSKDDLDLPFLFGYDWAQELRKGIAIVPPSEVKPHLFLKAAVVGHLASMKELWELSKKKNLSYDEQNKWNHVVFEAIRQTVTKNNLEIFKWLLEISYGIPYSSKHIEGALGGCSISHWPLVKYFLENNIFNARVITVSLDPKNLKKVLPSLEEVCVNARILIKHKSDFFIVGRKTDNAKLFNIRKASQRPAIKKITNTDVAVFNRLTFSATPEKQLIPQYQLYGQDSVLLQHEYEYFLRVLIKNNCREGVEWLLQEATHTSERLAAWFPIIARIVRGFHIRIESDPEAIRWLTKAVLGSVVQTKYPKFVQSVDAYQRGALADHNIGAFLQDLAPYIFDNYLPLWLKSDFPSLLLTGQLPPTEAVNINNKIKRAAVKFYYHLPVLISKKERSLTAEDYSLLDSIFCSAILMLKIALTKSDSEQKEAIDYAKAVLEDFENSGEQIDEHFVAHYNQFKLISEANVNQQAKNKALGLSDLPNNLISCAFNQWCAAEENQSLCYFLWHHSSQEQKEMLIKKHLVDIARNLPQWLQQELNELQEALKGESHNEQKVAIRQAKTIARDMLVYLELFDEETNLKLQELYQQFNTVSKTVPLTRVKRTIDCGETVFYIYPPLPEGDFTEEEEEEEQQNIDECPGGERNPSKS